MKRYFTLASLTLAFICPPAYANVPSCSDDIAPLKIINEHVADLGGFWTLFEKSLALRPHSSRAMQIDSHMNEILLTLDYLCETENGVPLNELATFVAKYLKTMSSEQFLDSHVELGKPEADVRSWLVYADYANKNATRKLDAEKIQIAIAKAGVLFSRYQKLSLQMASSEASPGLNEETLAFHEALKNFISGEPYMVLAIEEMRKSPIGI